MNETVKVLVYGDVNLNVIDGSAVWLPSIAEAWVKAGAEVHVQLKAVEKRLLLSGPLNELPGIQVHKARPSRGEALTVQEAADAILLLDNAHDFDVILVRGIQAATAVGGKPSLATKLWAYVTEFAYGPEYFDAARRDRIGVIARTARFMLAQTEDARAVLEHIVPEAAGKTLLLRPMVPDEIRPVIDRNLSALGSKSRPLRLIYTGKFAKAWRTDHMPGLVEELRKLGIHAVLTMVGDKVHNEPGDPNWSKGMHELMKASTPGIEWVGGKDRSKSLELVSESHLLLSWRSPELDLSLEISTKVLESSALGVPPLINRTPMHEAIFGSDYPLFVDASTDSTTEIAWTIRAALERQDSLSARLSSVIEPYRISTRAKELNGYLRRAGLNATTGEHAPGRTNAATRQIGVHRPLKVVLAGHDLKFAGELVDLLERTPNVELKIDKWETLHSHDETASRKALGWADVVICEWAGPNSVWYSQHKKAGQRLIVRLHMFEFRARWLQNIDTSQVDLFVAVSDYTNELVQQTLDVDARKVRTIPNTISLDDLQREPLSGREHRLGLVGFVPLLKRPDRAIDLLRKLRDVDDRFTLHLRGRMPWEYPHLWRKPEQRESYLDLFSRLGASDLSEAVAFEPFGADMGNWFRKIGWMLSPSTTESFHLAPVEGMASGAIPIVWNRPGAQSVFDPDFIVEDTTEAAQRILALHDDPAAHIDLQAQAQSSVQHFDEHTVSSSWISAITGS